MYRRYSTLFENLYLNDVATLYLLSKLSFFGRLDAPRASLISMGVQRCRMNSKRPKREGGLERKTRLINDERLPTTTLLNAIDLLMIRCCCECRCSGCAESPASVSNSFSTGRFRAVLE